MPRIKVGFRSPQRLPPAALVERLIDELKSNRESSQPFIYEQEYSTGKLRVLVVWDEWKDVPLEVRSSAILTAYEQAEGKDYRARVALASGLTVPEASAAGMLPYQIIAAVRKDDPVTPEQCRQAMIEEGATRLLSPHAVQLRLSSEEEAEACRGRLIRRLPQSEAVWLITNEAMAEILTDE